MLRLSKELPTLQKLAEGLREAPLREVGAALRHVLHADLYAGDDGVGGCGFHLATVSPGIDCQYEMRDLFDLGCGDEWGWGCLGRIFHDCE